VAQQVPRGQDAVVQIASLYVRERFSGGAVLGEEAESAWSLARPAIWRRWLILRFEVIRRFWRYLVPAKPSPLPEESDGYSQ
jgi:hypothetical protein